MFIRPGYTFKIKSEFVKNGESGEIYHFLVEENTENNKQTIVTDPYTDIVHLSRAFELIEVLESIVSNTKKCVTVDMDELIEIGMEDNRGKRYGLLDAYMETVCFVDEPITLKGVVFENFSGKPFSATYTCQMVLLINTMFHPSTRTINATYSFVNEEYVFQYSGFVPKKEIEKVRMFILQHDEIQEYIEQARKQLKEDRQHRVKALSLGVKL